VREVCCVWQHKQQEEKHKTIPVFVPHWGCPQSCLFCNQKKITGQKEEMTTERAREIIRQGIAKKKPDDVLEIGFFGGSFTGIPAGQQEALLGLAKEALDAGHVQGIRLSTRPDYINETVIHRLLRFDVTCVELGAQSMQDEVLLLNKRGHTAHQTRQAAKMIKDSGMKLGLQMMVGLPGDTEAMAMDTAEQFANMNADCVRIYPTLVICDTELQAWYKSGQYHPLSVDEAVSVCSRLYQYFTEKDIQVIRVGLLETEEGSLVAGPYHHAFGELVRSHLFYETILKALKKHLKKEWTVFVHPQDVSAVMGQKRENLIRLKEALSLEALHIVQDSEVTRGTVITEAK